VDCGHENLKITTPDDFYLAEAILRLRADREKETK
jgi:2-C-methyl-D-erythritol 4-phosphate cytidylyltransferase